MMRKSVLNGRITDMISLNHMKNMSKKMNMEERGLNRNSYFGVFTIAHTTPVSVFGANLRSVLRT